MGNVCPAFVDEPGSSDASLNKVAAEQTYSLNSFLLGIEPTKQSTEHKQNNILTIKGAYLVDKILPIISDLQQKKALYADPYYSTFTTYIQNDSSLREKYIWKRLHDIIQDPIIVDPEAKINIKFNNPDLGYFFVFLTFLSLNPKLIQDIILVKQNTYGIYALRIFVKGQVSEIVIDNKILCKMDSQPAFIESDHKHAVWPYIFQKAWMKINMKENIFLRDPLQPFKWFSNIPYRKIALNRVSKQNFINFISKNPKFYFYYFQSKKQPLPNIGLHPLQFFPLCLFQKQNQLFYFKNPTKQLQFRGNNLDKLTDDMFPLDIDEIYEQFVCCTTIFYYPSYKFTTIPIKYESKSQIFIMFSMQKSSSIPISIRIMKESGNSEPIMIDLIDIQRNKLIASGSPSSCFGKQISDVFQESFGSLQSGKYLLRICSKPKSNSKQQQTNSTVVFYTLDHIQKFNVASSYASEFQNYLQYKCQYEYNLYNTNAGDYSFCIVWSQNRGMMLIKKRSLSEKILKLQIYWEQTRNLFCKSHPELTSYTQIVKKQKDQTLQKYTSIRIQNIDLLDKVMLVLQKVIMSEETCLKGLEIQCE